MSTDAAPRTEMEQKLASYWREMLGVEVVKPADHFLEIGGNSLMATMLANRIESELGLQVSMVDLFNTLEQVAALCEELLEEQGGTLPSA